MKDDLTKERDYNFEKGMIYLNVYHFQTTRKLYKNSDFKRLKIQRRQSKDNIHVDRNR